MTIKDYSRAHALCVVQVERSGVQFAAGLAALQRAACCGGLAQLPPSMALMASTAACLQHLERKPATSNLDSYSTVLNMYPDPRPNLNPTLNTSTTISSLSLSLSLP